MSQNVELKIDWATYSSAKFACEHWHYSKSIPASKLVKIGVWENQKFIGVVIFGQGATSSLVKAYGLQMEEGCELVRIALRDHKTPVTRIVSIALKFLKKSNPGLKLVVSFADPEHGHVGAIYQAGGWIYSGDSKPAIEYLYKGKRWQGRSFRSSHPGKENSPGVKKVMGSSKHRYLMAIDPQVKKKIQLLAKPYPKRVSSIDSDASEFHLEEGSASLTDALHI